jgi:hypothetical protein
MKTKLILERFDRNHRLLEKIERPSRSFTYNFIGLLYIPHSEIIYTSPLSLTDINSVARDVDAEPLPTGTVNRTIKCTLTMGAPGGDSMNFYPGGNSNGYGKEINQDTEVYAGNFIGIQVGTGAGAVSPADVSLGTRILHGNGAGELEYGGCELLDLSFSDPDGEFTIRRYFTNNSGGGITVNEVGIHSVGGHRTGTTSGSSYIFLIARDLTGGVAVADTEILRVTYVPQITV